MCVLPRGLTVRKDAGLYGYERALRRAGLDPIAGVDEAGRGACAGPLVAGAAILPPGKLGIIPGLADSKLLTEAAEMQAATRSPFHIASPGTSNPSTGKPSVST